MTIATPVFKNENISAAVVAIISLEGIIRIVVDRPMSEKELWQNGLPIIYVVDEYGRAISHLNGEYSSSLKPLTNLKIVQQWKETNTQIQSALLPFEAEHEAKRKKANGFLQNPFAFFL